MSLPQRLSGALFGVATTDALGAPAEFQRRGTFPRITQLQDITHFGLPAGSWTDDTSMMLCLASSLIHSDAGGSGPKVDTMDQVRRYIAWLNEGYLSSAPTGEAFDVGNATRDALGVWRSGLAQLKQRRYSNGVSSEEEKQVQIKVDRLLDRPERCGNGSLMRVVPVPVAFWHLDSDELDRVVEQVGRVTHPHRTCQESCQLYVRLLAQIFRAAATGDHKSGNKENLFAELKSRTYISTPLEQMLGKYTTLNDLSTAGDEGISSSGFVVHTLEAALWAFFSTDSFREGAIRAVNLGDDADTVGAVYGGLAGAYYGQQGIPEEWILGLQQRQTLEEIVRGTVALGSRHITST